MSEESTKTTKLQSPKELGVPEILTPQESSAEAFSPGPVDKALRPLSLAEYTGQHALCRQLRTYLQAARERGEALDHVLLSGPPGLGKTTLAQIIAHEMQAKLHITSGPALEKPRDLASVLVSVNKGDVLFIDEIHRLPTQMEEILYPAMEDYRLDILVGEGEEPTKVVSVPIAPFTLVGATTRAGSLSAPLRDRFGVQGHLEYYTPEELTQIIIRSARLLEVALLPESAWSIARRARGTPRIANRMLRRIRDYSQVNAGKNVPITLAVVNEALEMLGVGQEGLDAQDERFLVVLGEQFSGGPAGVETLSVALGQARATLEDVIEPFLIQKGFIKRTARGRVLTDCGKGWLQRRAGVVGVSFGEEQTRKGYASVF